MSYTVSQETIDHLIKSEGVRYEVYDDRTGKPVSSYDVVKGYPTIGVGHLITKSQRDQYAKYLKPTRGKSGEDGRMTERQVQALLKKDLKRFIDPISAKLTRKPSQNQFDAFIHMAFNTGAGNRQLKKAIEYHNQGKYKEAGEALRNGPTTSKGKQIQGLVRRRNWEADLYLSDSPGLFNLASKGVPWKMIGIGAIVLGLGAFLYVKGPALFEGAQKATRRKLGPKPKPKGRKVPVKRRKRRAPPPRRRRRPPPPSRRRRKVQVKRPQPPRRSAAEQARLERLLAL